MTGPSTSTNTPQNQEREKRIALSIDRLVTQIAPLTFDSSDYAKVRQEWLKTSVEDAIRDHRPASSSPTTDVNHASDLIRRKLSQTSPAQALRFSNLYSRLLALPVLNQKWAILFLLHQLADSADPDLDDPHAYNEFVKEERSAREERRRNFGHSVDEEPDHDKQQRQHSRSKNTNWDNDSVDEIAESKAAAPATAADKQRQLTTTNDRDSGTGSPQKREVAIKSKLLATHDQFSDYEPSEPGLLRDLPYTLQGLSSTNLPFTKENLLRLPRSLPAPLISLLNQLAEPSLLYRSLDEFVKTPAKGLLNQSLRAAITDELRSYLTLVATLEGQIRAALASIDDGIPRAGLGTTGVTLKRCVVWTREATMGLRLLSMIAEESNKNRRGGQLISLIHGFSSSYGDPMVGAFAERLLVPVTRPFYDILRRWIYDGELSDPYLEFFVQEQSAQPAAAQNSTKVTGAGKSGGAPNVWEDKYLVIPYMVPSIMTPEFAEKVFLIGKSLNFIRHSCADAAWVDDYAKHSSRELGYTDTKSATLEHWIDAAYKTTMSRLCHLMTQKFALFHHLRALKSYMLLGQGDFIALLLESLAANLDRPANAQYRHTLTAQLEHAIRGSNAQYDSPEVLRRLDARMLQLSHGEIGWDCFTLEYKVSPPCDVVVSDWGSRQYLKVFNFLWRLKRVEFALASTWRKLTTGSRGVLKQTKEDRVAKVWKHTRGVLAEMVHFVGQLLYYILFEVIETSWSRLQARLARDDLTLDDMIHAHVEYLNSITHKGLLGARKRRLGDPPGVGMPGAGGADAQKKEDKDDEDGNSYMVQLGDLLRIMLAYRDGVDGLYSWSVSDFTTRQEADLASSSTTTTASTAHPPSKFKKPTTAQPQPQTASAATAAKEPHSEFPALADRLRNLGDRFRTRLQILLGDLAYQADTELRFLGVAMNFNDVYQPVMRKARTANAAAGKAGSGGAGGGGGGRGGYGGGGRGGYGGGHGGGGHR